MSTSTDDAATDTTPDDASEAAERARRSDHVERLGRAGFAAKGVLYVTVAAMAASIGVGGGGGEASQAGAIEQLSETPFGTVVLVLLAVGLAGYSLLRLLHAVTNPSGEDGLTGLGRRTGNLVRAAVYGGLTVTTVRTLLGGSGGSDDGRSRALTQQALELPLGSVLVGAAAVVAFVVAGAQLRRAITRDDAGDVEAGERARRITAVTGVIGHVARAVVFGMVGVLFARAALQSDASEAGGFSKALSELASTGPGMGLLLVVAAGLATYGVHCFAMARWSDPGQAD